MDGLANGILNTRCRNLTEKEEKALETAKAEAEARLAIETNYDGFALVEPPELHEAGRTHGNKNKPLYEGDSRDLDGAAKRDAKELEDAIKAGDPPIDADCAAAILVALQNIGGRTQKDYDLELGDLALAQLENFGFNEIVQNTCNESGPQTESQSR